MEYKGAWWVYWSWKPVAIEIPRVARKDKGGGFVFLSAVKDPYGDGIQRFVVSFMTLENDSCLRFLALLGKTNTRKPFRI